MKVSAFLATLRDRNIRLWADGDQLRCSAPVGTLTPALRDELRRRKDEILAFLRAAGSLARQQRAIVPLQPRGQGTPIFAFGGHNGDVFCFRALAQYLGEDQPFFGLQPPGLDGHGEPLDRVEDLAAYFAGEIRAFQPTGPYIIAGFCAGGTIAFELARQLVQQKMEIDGLALFGAPYATSYRRLPRMRKRLGAVVGRLIKHFRGLAAAPSSQWRPYLARILTNRMRQPAGSLAAGADPVLVHRSRVERATFAALRRYVPDRYPGSMRLFLPCREWVRSREKPLRWRSMADETEVYFGPEGCTTDVMLREPYAPAFARLFHQSRKPRKETMNPAAGWLSTPVSAEASGG